MNLSTPMLWAASVLVAQPEPVGDRAAGDTPPPPAAESQPAPTDGALPQETPSPEPGKAKVATETKAPAADAAATAKPSSTVLDPDLFGDAYAPPSVETLAEPESKDAFLDLNLVDLMSADIKVVSAARGSSASLEEAPAIIDVITQADFRLWGYQTTAEALNHILGFYNLETHTLPDVGIRGTMSGAIGESGLFKVMIDGRSVPQRVNNANSIGADLIPISAINRIEVIRGPASAMYGADAFLGVVNVITYRGDEINGATLTPSLNVTVPRDDSANLGGGFDGAFGAKRGRVSFMMAGKTFHEDRSGLTIPDSSPAPRYASWADPNEDTANIVQRSNVGYARIDIDLHKKAQLGFYGYFSHHDRPSDIGGNTSLGNRLDTLGRQRGSRLNLYQATAGFVVDVQPNEKSNVKFDARYFGGEPLPGDRFETGAENTFSVRAPSFLGGEGVLEGSWSITDNITAAVGTEVTIYDLAKPGTRRATVIDLPPDLRAGDFIDPDLGQDLFYNAGAFAQLTYTPFKKYLTLTGGFRYDYHKFYKSQYSGRVAAVSNPFKWLTVKVMYGRAFKAPSPVFLASNPEGPPGSLLGNPNLDPQFIDTIEGQLSFRYKGFFQATTGLAYNYITDYVGIVSVGSGGIPQNVAEASALSWESEIKANYKSFVGGYARFELNNSVVGRPDDTYINILYGSRAEAYPSFIARAGLFGQVPKVPLRLSANIIVVGPRNSTTSNSQIAGGAYTLDPYTLVGATLSTVGLEFIEGKETILSVTGRNLTNSRGANASSLGTDYPLSPLSIFIGLTQKL